MIYLEPTELNEFINKDERLVWTGQPKKGIIFRKSMMTLCSYYP